VARTLKPLLVMLLAKALLALVLVVWVWARSLMWTNCVQDGTWPS
jgi:hypothetical protein